MKKQRTKKVSGMTPAYKLKRMERLATIKEIQALAMRVIIANGHDIRFVPEEGEEYEKPKI